MSFENFPREACESWSDVGLVYTRNKYGRICSPPGYELSRKNDHCSFKNCLFKGMYKVSIRKLRSINVGLANDLLRFFMK